MIQSSQRAGRDVELQAGEISHLLDISPDPCLLVSNPDLAILAVNAPLVKLSGFTRSELLTLDLETLLPGIVEIREDESLNLELHSLQGQKLDLVNRRKQRIAVQLQARALGKDRRYAIYSFSSSSSAARAGTTGKQPSLPYQGLLSLVEIFYQSTLDQALEVILRVGKEMLAAESLGIYKIDSNHPQLKAVILEDPSGFLPKTISTTDFFSFYKEVQFSPPFKPPLSPLMERAAQKGSSFVISAPLDDSNAISGLIVAMGPANGPPPEKSGSLAACKLLVGATEGVFNNFILKSNLNERLTKTALKKAIGDTINKYMPEGILYLSTDLLIQQVNPSAEQILGYAEQEIINRHIDDVIIGTDRLTPALQDALDNIPSHDLGQLEIHHRDGSVFPALIKTFPVSKPETEEVQGILIFIQDISKEEKVRIQTQQLERRALVGQMNAIFAHEIRNPINNITTGIQLLDRILPREFEQREVLKGISDDCDRLTHIVDTVLTFSKSQSYHRTPLDLPILIDRILNRWVPRMKRTGVSHVLKVEEDLPLVPGDDRALGQVFNNLISNAVRAMEDTGGGVLSVRLKKIQKTSGAPGVQVDVLDTGPGIPPEVQDRIFEPFFTTKPDGTGLGLSITKQIITMHEGTITLEPLPEGTSFQIILPGVHQEEPKE
ncbi:MAG: nitrogen regulation protein NR(II) [Anaerolineales bacterium]